MDIALRKPNMTRPSDDLQSQLPTAPADEQPSKGRRRFIIAAGVAAAPLLVTLVAKPAQAQVTGGTMGNYGSAK
jgi:hypothetical protein